MLPAVINSCDYSVSRQALPDDLTLGVLLIFKGGCFHVHSSNKTFLSQPYVTHTLLLHNQPAPCDAGHLVVQPFL